MTPLSVEGREMGGAGACMGCIYREAGAWLPRPKACKTIPKLGVGTATGLQAASRDEVIATSLSQLSIGEADRGGG